MNETNISEFINCHHSVGRQVVLVIGTRKVTFCIWQVSWFNSLILQAIEV